MTAQKIKHNPRLFLKRAMEIQRRQLLLAMADAVSVTRHFIVDEKSILFSTVSTPLRHLHFADRTLLSTKLCSQIKIFRLELCVQ